MESALVNMISKKLKNNDTDFRTLNDSINSLRVSVFELEKENAALMAEVDKLRDRVEKLEKLPKVDDVPYFDLIREVQNRILKERNVLVFNVPELQSTSSSDTLIVANEILQDEASKLAMCFTDATWLENITKNNQPILIEFRDSGEIYTLLRAKMKLRNLNNWKRIIGNREKTKNQRLKMITLRTELRMRRENGESGLIIKYVNGEPTIVSKNLY